MAAKDSKAVVEQAGWWEFWRTATRFRLVQFVVVVALAITAAQLVDGPFYENWWFWVAISTAFAATLLEPHFTTVTSALSNGIGAIAIFVSADRAPASTAWWFYFALVLATVFCGGLAQWEQQSPIARPARWVATTLGRASLLGGGAMLIYAVGVATTDPSEGIWTFVATAAVVGMVALDWPRVLVSSAKQGELAVFEAAVEPNLILVSSPRRLRIGGKVQISKASQEITGHVVGALAHKSTSRYQIVVDDDWRNVLPVAGTECFIKEEKEPHDIVGFAVEGTDELSIRFQPVGDVAHAQPLVAEMSGGKTLYQVASLRLERDQWDGSLGLQARAVAAQVGQLGTSGLVRTPALPKPFQPVLAAKDLKQKLGDDYCLIGHVAGTKLPVGIRRQWVANDGHVAILGMSGTGKTSAAQLLSRAFEDKDLFVAVDGTGEYRSKLGWNDVKTVDWKTGGRHVYEPRGQLAELCTALIKAGMTAANEEYEKGEPLRRIILLEEAHSFLPEWNFATSNKEKETVYESARYILQARKFGISFVLVSQRTAVISKSALSQCENFMILRAIDETSLDFIAEVVGPVFRDAVAGLARHQAVCVGPIFSSESPVIVDLVEPASP